MELDEHIIIIDPIRKLHRKASEEYLSVRLEYPFSMKKLDIWVPVEYRRTGVSITDDLHLITYLNTIYNELDPKNYEIWLSDQLKFWDSKPRATVTKTFFDALADGEWHCRECSLPSNPNFARRIQDLKEFGYTIATDTNRYCPNCKAKKTHLMMLPISRAAKEGNGYEVLSPKLRERIIKVLGGIDSYEKTSSQHLLPDHKFSEIRWDDSTKSINSKEMSDDEIREKFQLLTNQRNQQKREICRNCFQTGFRGTIFGIKFFYHGTEMWDRSIPKKGKDAEPGCIGCPWYDIEVWRAELINCLNSTAESHS